MHNLSFVLSLFVLFLTNYCSYIVSPVLVLLSFFQSLFFGLLFCFCCNGHTVSAGSHVCRRVRELWCDVYWQLVAVTSNGYSQCSCYPSQTSPMFNLIVFVTFDLHVLRVILTKIIVNVFLQRSIWLLPSFY